MGTKQNEVHRSTSTCFSSRREYIPKRKKCCLTALSNHEIPPQLIPDSKKPESQDSGFLVLDLDSGFQRVEYRTPQANDSKLPESRLPQMGQQLETTLNCNAPEMAEY